MNTVANLTKIKKIPYNVASIAEKMVMIKAALADDSSFDKWSNARIVFFDSRLKHAVAEEDVRHQLSTYVHDVKTTLSYQADMASTLIDTYSDLVDVEAVLKDVYGDKYPSLKEQMAENKQVHLQLHTRLTTMPENSTIDDIVNVLSEIRASVKKS